MTDQPTGPEPDGTAEPEAGQPHPGSPGGGPPQRAGLSNGCMVSLVILAVAVILFGVCIVYLNFLVLGDYGTA